MPGRLDYLLEEAGLDRELGAGGAVTVMVIGGADTGKTTLVESIAALLSRGAEAGVVDLDMGQSHIGPPTTMGWARVSGPFAGWDALKAEDIYFVGSLSPPGSLLPAVAGAKRLVDRARAACGRVVIDTTGLIGEPVGRVLKQYKIELLCPEVVVALERADELAGITEAFRRQSRPRFLRVRVPDEVRSKSVLSRTEYRAERLKSYFRGAGALDISLDEVAVRFTREAVREGFAGRAVSLRDSDDNDLAIGTIVEMDARRRRALVRTPLENGRRASTLVVGTAVLDI